MMLCAKWSTLATKNIGYQEHWLPRTLATKKLRSRLADRETGGTSVNDLRV